MIGTLRSRPAFAFVIPFAITAQSTIPPNMLTRIALTYKEMQKTLIRNIQLHITKQLHSSWTGPLHIARGETGGGGLGGAAPPMIKTVISWAISWLSIVLVWQVQMISISTLPFYAAFCTRKL